MVLNGYLQAAQSVSSVVDGRITATISTGVTETKKINGRWFTATMHNDNVEVDLSSAYSDSWSVDIYSASLRSIPVNASVLPTAEGVRVSASVDSLGSGVYVMVVRVGGNTHAGRLLVTN